MVEQIRPLDLVLVGHIFDAQGIAGLVKLKPYASDPAAIFHAKTLWLAKPPETSSAAVARTLLSAKEHGGNVLLKLSDVTDRDQALAFKGYAVYISRADFPRAEDNAYYWVDLIGLPVRNPQGQNLGEVLEMAENAAQSILCVKGADRTEWRMIPFVDGIVQSVNTDSGSPDYGIVVAWELDW